MSRSIKRPYPKRPQQVSKKCRCHGGCPVCLRNRMYKHLKKMERVKQQLKSLDNEL